MRLDFERSLQQADTLLHADQAKSLLSCHFDEIEATADILHGKADLRRRSGEVEMDFARTRMLGDIAQNLLRHPINAKRNLFR